MDTDKFKAILSKKISQFPETDVEYFWPALQTSFQNFVQQAKADNRIFDLPKQLKVGEAKTQNLIF